MPKRLLVALLCTLAFSLPSLGQKSKKISGPAPDKALMQKIWDGWATINPDNVAQYYAKGPHVFYDLTPLKYDNWDEYAAGVKKVFGGYKSAKFEVNDDAQVHSAGEYAWATATIKSDMTTGTGKRELATFRWTVIWQKQEGKWLIVHEHCSAPMQ
ncbi:MAG TPA: nuclear transport factor 2 family protein [Candidatus Eisenbacteria bacterium]|jgi:ketosteroid isomerase-like protein|nr:nuclear transport factor 2 family protein [Candidatus Eisenbacteria bacterium]